MKGHMYEKVVFCLTSQWEPMLYLTSKKYNKKDFGLYLDDGLGVVKDKSVPETKKIKKNIQKIFKENKLDIVIQCNMKIVNYSDVSLNLNNSNYKPCRKPDNEILYTIKIQITHAASLNKSPHRLKK